MEPIETIEAIEHIKVSVNAFSIKTTVFMLFNLALTIGLLVLFIYLCVLLIKALRKNLRSSEVRKEKTIVRKSLGEALKGHRVSCKMTQEFVAERLGVSRQAVSKWENGSSDPSTANLLALAKLYGINAEELLRQIQ